MQQSRSVVGHASMNTRDMLGVNGRARCVRAIAVTCEWYFVCMSVSVCDQMHVNVSYVTCMYIVGVMHHIVTALI